MGKYIKLFDTHEEYEEWIEGSGFTMPSVSYCQDNPEEVHYDPWVRDYSKEYLTFEILSAGTITMKAGADVTGKTVSYSTDDGETWSSITTTTSEQSFGTFSEGDKILFKGTNTGYGAKHNGYYSMPNTFGGSSKFNVYGNIMSLLYGDNFEGETSLTAESCEFMMLFEGAVGLIDASNLILPATALHSASYYRMFYRCTSLTTAPELPAATLANNCYGGMFEQCTNLTSAPSTLPAATLANSCYYWMFNGCSSLTSAPDLAATTLAANCCDSMFSKCTSLITAPALPATTMAVSAYTNMFSGCTSLTTAPELPATTLADYCYLNMFKGCTSLTTAPALPATTLANYCYYYMFQGCTSLTTAPELPATTLVNSCYSSMFNGCTSLTSAPALPATTLSNSCYQGMFYNCSSLTTAPELPATTLAERCYQRMFNGCSSLTTAPELPATTLVSNCYNTMFYGCTKLNYIKAMFVTEPSTAYTSSWLVNVATIGVFEKNSSAEWTTTGSTGIPATWIFREEYNPTEVFTPSGYLTLTVNKNNSSIGLNKKSAGQTLYISKDASNWQIMSERNGFLTQKDEVYYLCGNLTSNNTSSSYTKFSIAGNISLSGNINSLWNYSDLNAALKDYCGYDLFQNCIGLTSAPELPATALSSNCYYGMFSGCTNLATIPSTLPATALTTSCYQDMFYGCSGLTSAPALPATTLANKCYYEMFYGCSGLTTGPSAISAVTMASSACSYMFAHCSGLTSAPALPATTTAVACYYRMFYNCSGLTSAPALPATTVTTNCYGYMFYNCKNLTTAPELPATTLVSNCYQYMFNGCSSLNYIKAMFTTEPTTAYTRNWVSNVASTGTFVKNASATWATTGVNGIPTGWTVQTASA